MFGKAVDIEIHCAFPQGFDQLPAQTDEVATGAVQQVL
jgi:hypothetical protein